MFVLYSFGPMIESYFGRKRFTAFYLLCGSSGAAVYLILWQFHVLVGNGFVPLVGASAGIFGVLIAAANVAPDATVRLIFPPIPMKLRTMAWGLIAVAVLTIFLGWKNAGGEAAHLGGAFMGYALIQNPRFLNLFDPASWKRRRSF